LLTKLVDNCPSTFMVCNIVGNIGRGLWLGGMMPSSTIAGNIMGDCTDLMFLNYNPGIGDQGIPPGSSGYPDGFPFDNEWVGNPQPGGGHTNSYYSNPALSDSRFFVRDGSIWGFQFEPTINLSNFPYFPCEISNLPNYSDPILYCQTLRLERMDEPFDLMVATNSIDWTNYLESFQWISKYYLYTKLFNDSLLLSSNIEYQSEKDSLLNTNIGIFESLRDSINQIANDSIELSNISSLINLTSSINTSEAIELYLKITNLIYLARINTPGFALNNSQQAWIDYISNLCSYEYGPSIYAARVLNALKDTTIVQYNNCAGLTTARNLASYSEKTNNILISPNPSTGKVSISVDDMADLDLEVIDQLGNIVLKMELTNSSIVDLSSARKGLYLFVIKNSTNIIYKEKLIIL
jgi:hypothetical protein